MFLLFPFHFVLRQLFGGIHQIQQFLFADIAQVEVNGGNSFTILIGQRHDLYCKAFVLFESGHREHSLKVELSVFEDCYIDYVGTAVVYVELAVDQPFVLKFSKFWLSDEGLSVVPNLKFQVPFPFLEEDVGVIGVYHQTGCIDRYLRDQVDLYRFLRRRLLLFFFRLLPLHDFNHKLEGSALDAFLVEAVSGVVEKELIRFKVYNSTVQCFQFLYLVTVFVFAHSLKLQALLSAEGQLDG